jgi:hypothetical protein
LAKIKAEKAILPRVNVGETLAGKGDAIESAEAM